MYYALFLYLSVIFNIALLGYILYLRRKAPSEKVLSEDARQILHDLTRGGSLVRITPIDASDLLIRGLRR